MNPLTKSELLAQIAQIQLIERGKLSAYTFKDRSAQAVPYYKLQCWEGGKNVTRYIRPEQVPLLEQALAGHAKFQELIEQYTTLVIQQTRERLSDLDVKKKPSHRSNSTSPKRPRSKT